MLVYCKVAFFAYSSSIYNCVLRCCICYAELYFLFSLNVVSLRLVIFTIKVHSYPWMYTFPPIWLAGWDAHNVGRYTCLQDKLHCASSSFIAYGQWRHGAAAMSPYNRRHNGTMSSRSCEVPDSHGNSHSQVKLVFL